MPNLLPILAVLGGMFFLMAGAGLHSVILPIRGVAAEFTSYELGWLGTGYAIGFMVGCLLVPHLVRRVGHVRTFSVLLSIISISVLLLGFYDSALFWIFLRSISGFCMAGCYMVAESWLNERSSNEGRGTVFSIYTIVALGALMIGQYMLVLDEIVVEPLILFMLCAILYSLAVVPMAVSKAQSPAPLTHVNLDLKKLYNNSPAAFIGAFLCGVISSAWISFAPVFGTRVNMSTNEIATLLVFAYIGSLIFQYPIGRLSDKTDRRYVMILIGIVGVVTGSLMTILGQASSFGFFFYIAAIGYGGVIFSIYSLVIAHANDYADASDFVETSSGMLIIYGSGTVAGPLFAAYAMDTLGPSGVFTTTTIGHLIFAAHAFYRTFRRDRAEESERTDFQATGIARVHTPESYALDPRADEVSTEENSADEISEDEEKENSEENLPPKDLPPMPSPVKVE